MSIESAPKSNEKIENTSIESTTQSNERIEKLENAKKLILEAAKNISLAAAELSSDCKIVEGPDHTPIDFEDHPFVIKGNPQIHHFFGRSDLEKMYETLLDKADEIRKEIVTSE